MRSARQPTRSRRHVSNEPRKPPERSRSGNGAHAWFFFTAPIAAATVRRLGCFLITETMARRHELSMESYDRLFPNQDTMPKGGFGNLIALPLQKKARDLGNSVFVDGSLKPWPDQWAFLASVKRIEPALVYRLVDEAGRRGQVLGVRMATDLDEDDRTPWQRRPSRRPPKAVINEPLPEVVRKGTVSDLIAGYGQVILDESHHCPAVSFERVLAEVKARYVLGLTATPQRRDGHHPILHMQLGPTRFAVDSKSQAAKRPSEHKLLVRETGFSVAGLPEGATIQEL